MSLPRLSWAWLRWMYRGDREVGVMVQSCAWDLATFPSRPKGWKLVVGVWFGALVVIWDPSIRPIWGKKQGTTGPK